MNSSFAKALRLMRPRESRVADGRDLPARGTVPRARGARTDGEGGREARGALIRGARYARGLDARGAYDRERAPELLADFALRQQATSAAMPAAGLAGTTVRSRAKVAM